MASIQPIVSVPWSAVECRRNLNLLIDQIRLDNDRRALLADSVESNAADYYQVVEASVSEILAKLEDIQVDFVAGKILQFTFPDTSIWKSVKFNKQTGCLQLMKTGKTVTVDMEHPHFSLILRLMVSLVSSYHQLRHDGYLSTGSVIPVISLI